MKTIPLPSTAMDVCCFSSRETKKAAYTQIQSDIATLTNSILALKTHHNSLNNTARLSDELLARIFTWNLSMQRKDEQVNWIKVAAVCTSWRRVALNCPQLWSFIRHRRTAWITKVLLPRSGDFPLHINVTLCRRMTWEGFRKALKEIHRIRKLAFKDLYVAPVRIDKLLSGLTDPAPILESFRVDTASRRNVHHLPDDLFSGFAPKLWKLKLRSCIISTSSPLISGITFLVLEDISSCMSFSQLVMLLRGIPNVETLKLRKACKFDADGSGELSPKDHVELSNLRHLVMNETVIGCGIILSRICHASRLSYLEIQPNECDTNQAQDLGNQLAARISSISHLKIFYMAELEIYGRWEEADKPPMGVEFHIHLDYDYGAMKVILGTLPLENLRSLRTTCDLALDFWLEGFGELMYLNTVRVENHPAEFIKALTMGLSASELGTMLTLTESRERIEGRSASDGGYEESVSGDEADADNTEAECTGDEEKSHSEDEPYCALLDTLPLVPSPLRFMALKTLQIGSWRSSSPGLDTNLLAAVLEARSIRGSTLEKLSIENCIHYSLNADKDEARIRRVVGCVIWDVKNGHGLLHAYTYQKSSRGKIFETRRRSTEYSSDFHESSVPDSSDRGSEFGCD